ncbi:MAG TPA: hypothetical protein VHX61_00215 [Rhizomicrobium sp.]|nr:hypothetical protein [Rhizomicrobium sp.]
MARQDNVAMQDAATMPAEFSDRHQIGCIIERDVDILLLMALHSSADFRDFVASRTLCSGAFEFIDAWRGVVFDETGESDLLVLFKDKSDRRIAVLIEDKIDAPFQPDQAVRYAKRGQNGVDRGWWESFVTCLCAPARFAEPLDNTNAWGKILTYEQIDARLRGSKESFAPFLRLALRQAVEKERFGGFVADTRATKFWQSYRSLCCAEFHDLHITGLGEVASVHEPWPRFAAGWLPERIKLEHKAAKGCVDMTFKGERFDELHRRLDGLLPPQFDVVHTSPSSAIRLLVPVLDAMAPFEPQAESARSAFMAVRIMLALWPTIRETAGFSLGPKQALA